MPPPPICYSAVYRGRDALASYAAPSASGSSSAASAASAVNNFRAVAASCLERCPPGGEAKCTFVVEGFTYNYVVDGSFTFLAVSAESTGRALPFAYLETVRAEFSGKHAATPQALSAPAGGLERAFSPRLRAAAEHLASHPEAASKVAGLQAQVDAVRSVMVENIEQVLARGERIENLVDKTDDLRSQADRFQRTGAALRRRMWWNNVKMWAVVGVLLACLALVIFLSVCFSGGGNCFKKKQS